MLRRYRKRRPRRGPRKSRAKPKTGWTLPQLARLAGVTLRTARHYFEQEVVPRPIFRGSATRYDRRHLLWLVAVRRLRAQEQLGLAQIKTRITGFTTQQLESFVTADLPAGELATALGVAPKPVVHQFATPRAIIPPIEVTPDRRWTRLELAVGLELHVRDDVTTPVIELAKRVYRMCVYGEQPMAVPSTTGSGPPER